MTAQVRPFFDRIPIELVAQVFTSGFMSGNYRLCCARLRIRRFS